MKLRELGKESDFSGVLLGLCSGSCFGSLLELMVLNQNRYPFRIPFNKVTAIAGFLLSVIIFGTFLIMTISNKNITSIIKMKLIIRFLLVAMPVSIITSLFLWGVMTEAISYFKRAIGMSSR